MIIDELATYNEFFNEIIETINNAKYKAFKSLNRFHIEQNYEIGKIIVKNQERYGWGKSIVDTLSKDVWIYMGLNDTTSNIVSFSINSK